MKKGFTLIELLVALVISGLVITAIYNIFISNNRIYLRQNEIVKMEQGLRSVVNLLCNDIIMAGYDPTGNYTLGIEVPSTDNTISISYYDDTSNNATKINYDIYDSSTYGEYTMARREVDLNESFSETNRQPIMSNVKNLQFNFCNKSNFCNTNASLLSEICYVNIFIETFSNKNHMDIPDLSMNKTVYIRNSCI